MRFITGTHEPTEFEANTVYLIKGAKYKGRYDDSWNDYGYRTNYTLIFCEDPKSILNIGCVQIGEFNMKDSQYSPNLPSDFEKLHSESFFSISHDSNYYETLSKIKNDKGYDILFSLNDFTVCDEVFQKAKAEEVTKLSLLRNIRESEYDTYVKEFYQLLKPPINLNTMRKIYGSTGWGDVDKGLIEMQRLLFDANIHYYYNAIATIGREILKGIAGKIYDDDLHRDKVKFPKAPTEDQYINKLHGYIDCIYEDKQISENIKKYIKSTIELVQGYVHKENGEKLECFMCVHAVISLAYQLSILNNKNKYGEEVTHET